MVRGVDRLVFTLMLALSARSAWQPTAACQLSPHDEGVPRVGEERHGSCHVLPCPELHCDALSRGVLSQDGALHVVGFGKDGLDVGERGFRRYGEDERTPESALSNVDLLLDWKVHVCSDVNAIWLRTVSLASAHARFDVHGDVCFTLDYDCERLLCRPKPLGDALRRECNIPCEHTAPASYAVSRQAHLPRPTGSTSNDAADYGRLLLDGKADKAATTWKLSW